MYELASESDNKILNTLLNDDRYEILKSYDINVALFVKYGKKDKEGNLKTPALTKNGIAIPAQIKLVSNFNRITDDTDVKIILNAELWQDLSIKEKTSTIDNMLAYIAIKEDKDGEPLTISESCDKVQLKLRHPDFYCEGFLNMLQHYKKDYIPWQEASNIADKVTVKKEDKEETENSKSETTTEIKNEKKNKKEKIEENNTEKSDITTDDLLNEILTSKK